MNARRPIPFIPAQAGIQGPQTVALGPRFRGDERMEFFDYITTTLLTTYRAYARPYTASLIEGVF